MPNSRFYRVTPTGREYPGRIMYLNVGLAPGTVLNAVLFVVSVLELAAFDEREWIYQREDVTDVIANGVVIGGRAFMYVGGAAHGIEAAGSPTDAAIRSTYLQILDDAVLGQTEEFRKRYYDSTDAHPSHLVIQDLLDEAQSKPAHGAPEHRPSVSAQQKSR